ncbi:neuropeptide FF receptor 1-like [Paramuricea clavata]|uniref:Neuropeptide FF receptor 1-like n=1 Tax=Paramuricea clavata TaxID=317549 RepID=A0A6S7JQ08_PARCT|nr:neuropeptide FF receptor 1-like [Paramuricea clavata]
MNTTLGNRTGPTSHSASSYLGYAFISVSVLGSLGNILSIFSICRQKALLKTNHYYLVLHLAICDLLNMYLPIAYSYTIFTGKFWITSPTHCKLTFLHGTFFTAGVLFMVFMSLLRYRVVFCPLRPAVSRWKLHLAAAAVYIFGVLCQIPVVFVLDFIPPDKCFEAWPSETLCNTYTVFLSSVHFFIPVVVLGMIYWKISRGLIKQSEKIKSMNANIATVGEKTERWLFQRLAHHRNTRTFVISFLIFVCFLVAGSPQQIAFILYVFGVVDLNGAYYDWFNVMYFFGVSAVNPFIYGALDKKLFSSFKRCGRKNQIGILDK